MFLIDLKEIFPMQSSEFTKSLYFGSNWKKINCKIVLKKSNFWDIWAPGLSSARFFFQLRFSVATLFRIVALFARVRIEDSSRNRFALNGIQRDFFEPHRTIGIYMHSGLKIRHIYNVSNFGIDFLGCCTRFMLIIKYYVFTSSVY